MICIHLNITRMRSCKCPNADFSPAEFDYINVRAPQSCALNLIDFYSGSTQGRIYDYAQQRLFQHVEKWHVEMLWTHWYIIA